MAGYGVTEDPEGLLEWSWAEQRLLAERNFWFVTANAEGRPHSMPVWGVWMPERERFGMACDFGARKARNIKTNDQVVVTTTNSVECVSLEGGYLLRATRPSRSLLGGLRSTATPTSPRRT